MRGLYESHARPLTRIVRGLPTSWDPSIATMRFTDHVTAAAWSPCSRSIAISCGICPATVEILDAATLVRLTILEFPTGDLVSGFQLIFSPDGCLLTWAGSSPVGGRLISWDLQTGVVVSAISEEVECDSGSIAYSACGTILGVLSYRSSDGTVNIYNALSGTHMCSHLVGGLVKGNIWAHGEYLRFATMTPESITIWETGFSSTHAPTEVETLSIPDGCYNPKSFLIHPTLPRVVLIHGRRVRVWDTQDSKFLLDFSHAFSYWTMSFSHDGRFFACDSGTSDWILAGIHLWKESHTGYVLRQKLIPISLDTNPLISPNGGSVIAFGRRLIQLWRTMDSTTSLSAVSAQTFQRSDEGFLLGFSPDEALAAVVRKMDKTITVLDLKSGVPRLTIDAGMELYGLGITGSNIVAIGEGEIVTWDLPAGDHVLDLRANITDSVRTVTLDNDLHGIRQQESVTVSPDLHHVATVRRPGPDHSYLGLYDAHTGQHLQTVTQDDYSIYTPWFTPDGREVWCERSNGGLDGWKVVEDSKSDATELEYLGSTTHRPDGPPSRSSRGYQVTEGWWILGPSRKRLLWLPPQWRSGERQRMWGKLFLALLHSGLPEVVILELE